MKFLKTLTWMGGIPKEQTIQRIEIPSQELDVNLAGIFFETSLNSVGFIKITAYINSLQINFLYWIEYFPDKNKLSPYFDDINLVIKNKFKGYKVNDIPKCFKADDGTYFLQIPSKYDVEFQLANYISINHKNQDENLDYFLTDSKIFGSIIFYNQVFLSVNNEPAKLIAIVQNSKTKTNTEFMIQPGPALYTTFKNIKYIHSLKIFLTDSIGSKISTTGTCILHFISK